MKRVTAILALLMLTMSGCLGFGDDKDDDKQDHPECPGDDDHTDSGDSGDESQEENNTTLSLVTLPVLRQQGMNTTGNETMEDGEHDHDAHDECPEEETDDDNIAPAAALIMSSAGEMLGNVSAIMQGDEVTFDGSSSSDADGEIVLASITVTDRNGTRTLDLMDNGTMVEVSLQFDFVGNASVTFTVMDDDATTNTTTAMIYINEAFAGSGSALGPLATDDITTCKASEDGSGQTITRDQHWFEDTFNVNAGARWIEVTTSGDETVGICTADDTSLANGEGSATTDDMELAASVGYRVIILPDGPNDTFTYSLVVHYEPKP